MKREPKVLPDGTLQHSGTYIRSGQPDGPPTGLTPIVHKTICDLIATGATADVAAAAAGQDRNVVGRWLRRGRAELELSGARSIYARFAADYAAADARAHLHAVIDVVQVRRRDPRIALQYLERRYPNEWGRRIAELHHTGVVATVHTEVDLSELLDLSQYSDEQLAVLEVRLRDEDTRTALTTVPIDVEPQEPDEGGGP